MEIDEVKSLYNVFKESLEAPVNTCSSFMGIEDALKMLLQNITEIRTREELEQFKCTYKEVEENYEDILEEVDQFPLYQSSEEQEESTSDLEQDDFDLLEEGISEKEKEIVKKENVFAFFKEQYDVLDQQNQEVLNEIKRHRALIQDYLDKIAKIKAYEVTVYRSNILEKAMLLAEKVVSRSIEAKIISSIGPKKVAQLYFITKIFQDTKKVLATEDFAITKWEVDADYYKELVTFQLNMKDYRNMFCQVLYEVKDLKSKYKEICGGFPNDFLYKENLKKVEDLEEMLLQEALQLEIVIDDYNEAMECNNQKIKVLKEQ